MIKILHITAGSLNGGAARAVYNLSIELNNNPKIISKVLTNYLIENESKNAFSLARNKISQFYNKLLMKLDSWISLIYFKKKDLLFTSGIFGLDYNDVINDFKPDIVHIHWISGMVSLKSLSKLKVPIVWTFRDSWPFTGGCHVAFINSCSSYKTHCYSCPQLMSKNNYDLSYILFKIKKKYIDPIDLNVVCISKYILNETKASPIYKNKSITYIPNSIDSRFFPDIRRVLYHKMNYILTGALNNSDHHKGFNKLIEISGKLDSYMLVVFGSVNKNDLAKLSMPYLHIESPSVEQLRVLYSNAKLFVSPTMSESFGKVFLESITCATPVVGFKCTGQADLIIDGVTGYSSIPFCTDSLLESVIKLLTLDNKSYTLLKESCVKYSYRFKINTIVNKHISLYSDIANL